MTDPTQGEPDAGRDAVADGSSEVAQRPRLVSRLRLVPLLVLMVCVSLAACAGFVNGGPVTSGAPASAAPDRSASGTDSADKAAVAKARAKNACTPTWSSGTKGEPWQGKRRKASEKTFTAHVKKENPAYIKGKNGWLFFTDYQAQDFSQSVGRVTQSAKQQRAWAKFLARSAKQVKQAGGEYHVVVAPAKWDVYPQQMPTWAHKLRGTTSLTKLMKAHPGLPWIDTRAALRQAGRKHKTYEPLDSHWTPYGGYVAWKAIARCLKSNAAFKGIGVPPIKGVGKEPNNNEFVANGVPSGKPARTVPRYAQPHPPTTVTHIPDGETVPTNDDMTDAVYAPMRTSTQGAQLDKTMLVLRDSTGNSLSPLWSWSFATTIQYAHGIGMEAKSPKLQKLLRTYHPDLVLFVITERFLSLSPPRK